MYPQSGVADIDSIFIKLFDRDLKQIKNNPSVFLKMPIIIVSNTNCAACVKYFTKKNNDCGFVFILSNESLLEIKRTLEIYDVRSKTIFFTTSEYVRKEKREICSGPSPTMILKKRGVFRFYNYWVLDSITQGFSDKKFNYKKLQR